MADNVEINAVTTQGGATIATKDVDGVQHELVVLEFNDGAGGVKQVAASDPLPVTGTVSISGSATDNTQLYSGNISTIGAITGILTTGYQSISTQITGVWVGNLIIEGSNDNVNWGELISLSTDELSMQDSIYENGIFLTKVSTKYVRLNVTQLQTGTVTALIIGRVNPGINAADLLSLAMDRVNKTPLQVQLPQDLKQEADGSLLIADMKGPYNWQSATVSQPLVIDCIGYQSVIVHKITAGIITPTISNDGINFYATLIRNTNGILPAAATMPAATGVYITPVQARYIKLTGPASAVSAIVYLSQSPYNLQLNFPFNIGGTDAITGGIAGSLAVGGNVANGVAPTANPIQIAGVDALKIPLTRRVLSDSFGRVQIGNTPSQLTRGINTLGFEPEYRNVLEVQDTSVTEGSTQGEILMMILNELKILNLQINQLPGLIDKGIDFTEDVDDYRNELSILK